MAAETHTEPRDQAGAEEVVAQVLAGLRGKGQRITTARRAVIEALARSTAHPSVDQLCSDIERILPGVHRSTIYRTVETLDELGAITHVHMGHGTTTYHLAGPVAASEHLHAQCRVCGRVIDLRSDALEPVKQTLEAEAGFVLDARHVALSGTCRDCRTESLG